MVDFRRMIPVLAVIALLLGLSVTASAQPLACFTSGGVNTPDRAEGLTELVGDFLITCQNGTSTPMGVPVPTVNIQVFLNTAITSRLMTTSTTLPAPSEAVLLLDEPAPGAQFGCGTSTCTNVGSGSGVGFYGATLATNAAAFTAAGLVNPGSVANRNVFQGVQTASNAVTFFGIPIDPPGTSGNRVIRITNIRGNANALGVAGTNATPVSIFETITATPFNFLPVNGLATQAVGSVQRGLQFGLFGTAATTTALTPNGLQQCVSRDATGGAIAVLRYTELFGTAFKRRNIATTNAAPLASAEQNSLTVGTYNTESGYTVGALAGGSLPSLTVAGSCPGGTCGIGQADFGTRLKAVFNNIPAGVNIFVDRVAGTAGVDFAQLTASEAGPFSALAATASSPNGALSTQLPITNNSATAVWEVLDSTATSIVSLNFRVWVTYTAAPATNSPALATATVNGSYAPTSTVTTASSGPIPRFADTSTAQTLFTVIPCTTTLLFPYVTSAFGFDTGIAISSTSTDPFGTPAQSGPCTLNWYGAAFTGATPTPVVNSGTTYTTLTSLVLNNVTGGFNGYMIAQCRFQYAHGMAFITDLGARNLAMGYLALVIPDPTLFTPQARVATQSPCIATQGAGCFTTGEGLTP